MSLKRTIQHSLRKSKSFLRTGSIVSENLTKVREALRTPCPDKFDSAIFNFTIDFELLWGNGNLGGSDHSRERRLTSASFQKQNFKPFLDMLSELGVDISWAIIGKLADHDILPSEQESFRPDWSKTNWYDDSFKSEDDLLWNGEYYLKYIKENFPTHEVMSHGHHHIDFFDKSVTLDVAQWDMITGIKSLRNFGFEVDGFVYPCNKQGYFELLKENSILIIRGSDNSWKLDTNPIQTPIGFWISPAFMSAAEIINLIDIAVEKKSFFHPWMHLNECDLSQNDIENFYRPIFKHVVKLQNENKIKNLSFRKIAQVLSRN